MKINRRDLLVSVPVVSAVLAANAPLAEAYTLPANKNVKWAVASAIWTYIWAKSPTFPWTDMLDVMKETGFIGVRMTSFPGILKKINLTEDQMRDELSKRGLYIISISWGGPLHDPAQRQQVLDSAKRAMTWLSHFGANYLCVFPPGNREPGTNTPAAFEELCERCNQIGELAGELGFRAGMHNHMDTMVQSQEEIDRFMAMTDPKLFGLCPNTAHLDLAGCNVVGTLNRYKNRIHFVNYKDAKWTTPTKDLVEPNGLITPPDSPRARFLNSIYDLGDGEVDFPGCHRVLKSVNYKGWICVNLDTSRLGPMADYKRCGDYVVNKLQPIYM